MTVADPSGIAIWPGVLQVLNASLTLSLGVTPSIATLEIVPQSPDSIADLGTLQFVYGGTTVSFKGCKVDKALYQYTQAGFVHHLSIFDKRWRWQFGAALGVYNERRPGIMAPPVAPAAAGLVDANGVPPANVRPTTLPNGVLPPFALNLGSIDARSEAAPQVLAAYLLSLLLQPGEAFDVSQLPNDTRPEVRWDFDPPAAELARLCDSLGCKVALGTDDVVRIVRAGVGAELPGGSVLRVSQVVDPPEKPDAVAVVGGYTRYQVDFDLEAVGLDVDGTVRQIDKLSYKPAAGWSKILPDTQYGFMEVTGWEADPLTPPNAARAYQLGYVNPRELARQSVYRWYRISMAGVDDPILKVLNPQLAAAQNRGPQVPGWGGNPGGRIDYLWQVLPIEDRQVEGFWDVLAGNQFQSFPAWVFGQFFTHSFPPVAADGTPGNSSPGSFCYLDFDLDQEKGVVRFAEPVYYLNADWSLQPAKLTLRVAVSVRDAGDGHTDRPVYRRPTPGATAGTQDRFIRRDDVARWVVPTYDADHNVAALRTSDADAQALAGYYLDAAMLELQTQTPSDATYAGLLDISPDGRIVQVTWEVGAGGATTRACTHTEWNPVVPSYRERYLAARLRGMPDVVQALQDQARQRR